MTTLHKVVSTCATWKHELVKFKGFTIIVTTPLNNEGPGYSDPIFTIIRAGRFGRIEHQATIYASFGSRVKARAAATAAAYQWIEERLRTMCPVSGQVVEVD